ncbi:hypothetical protein Tco_1184655 [Tanacetum coccineum]
MSAAVALSRGKRSIMALIRYVRLGRFHGPTYCTQYLSHLRDWSDIGSPESMDHPLYQRTAICPYIMAAYIGFHHRPDIYCSREDEIHFTAEEQPLLLLSLTATAILQDIFPESDSRGGGRMRTIRDPEEDPC